MVSPYAVLPQLLRAMLKTISLPAELTGFPRNAENFSSWESIMGSRANIVAVLFLDCNEDVMTQRLLKRGETSGRVDDNKEAIQKRFATYKASTMPIVRMFESRGLLKSVDAGQDVQVVREKVRGALAC